MTRSTDDIWSRLADPANLDLAWRRAARHFATSTHFVDQAAVGAFGADRTANIAAIGAALAQGEYRTRPLRAAPVPKPTGGRAVVPEMRPVYWVEPGDQVAWLAVVNVIGPALDAAMPRWSYGHRLQEGPGVRTLDGSEAPIPDQLLWPPAQSWPIFQRHVLLAARSMRDGGIDPAALSVTDAALWRHERDFACPDRACADGVKFAAIDFKSYTASIDLGVTRAALAEYCPPYRVDAAFRTLVDAMLAFEIGDDDGRTIMPYVPVGLIVQGFLNNVAMLPIDRAVDFAIGTRRVAHFRFVDDHVVLAPDPATLIEWIDTYRTIVAAHNPRLHINRAKLRPPGVAAALDDGDPITLASLPDLDPDQPAALWQPVRLRPVGPAVYSARPWPQTIDAVIDARLRGIFEHGHAGLVALPDGPHLSEDERHQLAALFDRNLALMRVFRDRRSMLRGVLLLLAKTGMPGIDRLTAEFAGLMRTAPTVGDALAALTLQMLAPIVAAAALRATDAAAPPRLRRGAIDFLLSLDAIEALRPHRDAAWPLERSWADFSYGATVAATALALRAPGCPEAARASRLLSDFGVGAAAAPDAVLAWTHWFADFAPRKSVVAGSATLQPGEQQRI